MKSVLLVVFALCVACFAYPRPENVVTKVDEDESIDSDTEFVRVPLELNQPRRAFEFGLGFPEFAAPPPFDQDPFYRGSPFGGIGGIRPHGADGDQVDDFMTQMQEMLREMRKQLTALVHHAHRDHGIGEDDGSVGTRIGDDDLPKNQTTSTTKVIDGHVVTVNETTYTSGDDNIGAVFRIKVVEVVPSESPEGEAEGGSEGEESKPEEPSSEAPGTENETFNNKSELEEDGHETNEIPNHSAKVQYEWGSEFDPSLNEIEQPSEDNSVEQFTPVKEQYHDLSQDTNVNDYLSDQALSQGLVMIDPDAEFVNADANAYYRYETEPQRVQRVNV